jgi:hypothetical protein
LPKKAEILEEMKEMEKKAQKNENRFSFLAISV